LAALFVSAVLAASVSAQLQRPEGSAAPPAVTVTDQAAPATTAAHTTASPERVVIVRESLHLTEPSEFRVPLQLEPIRSVDLAATVDGVVRSVQIGPGQAVAKQAEAIRMENMEQQLILNRATALYKAAQIEAKRAAAAGDRDQADLAGAQLEAAKAEFELAQYRLERMSVRVPFDGTALDIRAIEGQVVRAGEPLATVADTSRLRVEIPVDRKTAAPGAPIQINIEETPVSGVIEQVLPLDPRFEKLRDIVNSAATAVVIFDNAGDRFKVGQTVHAPVIPRHPVAEIANGCLANTGDGNRKVQVIRNNVVRDVNVQLLGQVGAERVHVSGPLDNGDEIIVSASQPLVDGTQVRQATDVAVAQPPGGAETRTDTRTEKGARPPAKSKTGF
jgi:RND family efflux transporter MFP subunit